MRRIVVATLLAWAILMAPAPGAAEDPPAAGFSGVSYGDPQHGWTVFLAPCGDSAADGSCAHVYSTTDGGQVWRPLRRLHVCAGKSPVLCWVRAHRISAKVGFVSGWVTMMTADGGRSWARVNVPHVAALTAVPGGVFALTYPRSGCPLACNVGLRHAATGDRVFTPVRSFRNPSQGWLLDLDGAGDNLYATGYGDQGSKPRTSYARISISRDGGRTWSLRGDPCRVPGGAEFDMIQLEAAGSLVAALCWQRGRDSASIMLSRDAGRTFARVHAPMPGGYEVALGPDGSIGVVTYTGKDPTHFRVALSRDLGRTWRVVLRSDDYRGTATFPGLRIFGRSLRAATGDQMWRSEDAGASWLQTSIATLGT